MNGPNGCGFTASLVMHDDYDVSSTTILLYTHYDVSSTENVLLSIARPSERSSV